MPAGVISFSLAASGSARSWVNTLIWAWMNRCACSAMAAATFGWACPVELTAMPAAKSRYSCAVDRGDPAPRPVCDLQIGDLEPDVRQIRHAAKA